MGAPDSLWLSGAFVSHVDVLVERPSGSGTVLQSLRDFGGVNWIKSWRVEPSSADTPIGSGTVTLHRQVGALSLSPMVTASALNQNGGLYAPALDFAREVEVRVCNLPRGTEPVSEDWVTLFQGIADDPSFGGKTGDVSLPFRDRSGPLADTFIRERITYGSEDGIDAATVMQSILDRWMGTAVYPLQDLVAGARYMVTEYTPSDISVWEALQALALAWGGKALRQWPDGSGQHRITVMEPFREKETPDYSIPPSLYIDIPNLSTGSTGFRNIVRGVTNEASTGIVLTSQIPAEEDVDADPLVLKYGERALTFTEDSSKGIDTQAELDAMVAAAYSDVSALTFPMDVETRLAPFAALDDIVAWGDNQILFDNAQNGAVIGLVHEGSDHGKARTRWKLADRPVATVAAWLQRAVTIRGLTQPQAPLLNIDWKEAAGTVSIWWKEQYRGQPVDTRVVWLKVGPDVLLGPNPPTRGPGDTSVVLAGSPTLESGEYEYDFPKDLLRVVTPVVDVTLSTGETHSIVFPPFDPDTQPTLGKVDVIDRIIRIYGADSETQSLKVERIDVPSSDPGYHVDSVDGRYYDFTVPDPGAFAATYRVYAFSVPKAEVTSGTPVDSKDVVVAGSTYTPGSEPEWVTPTADAPSLGSSVVTMNLMATSAPSGYTAHVDMQVRTTGAWSVYVEITSELSPSLTAPPTSLTAYDWDATYVRAAALSALAQFNFRLRILNGSGVLKATETVPLSYFYDNGG